MSVDHEVVSVEPVVVSVDHEVVSADSVVVPVVAPTGETAKFAKVEIFWAGVVTVVVAVEDVVGVGTVVVAVVTSAVVVVVSAVVVVVTTGEEDITVKIRAKISFSYHFRHMGTPSFFPIYLEGVTFK